MELQKTDGEIIQAAETAEGALAQYERSLEEAERAMRGIEREEEEQQSRAADVRAVEQKLSDSPAA